MKNLKILVTRKWPKIVENKLQDTFSVKLNNDDVPLTEDQLIHGMQNFDALLPTVTDQINDKIIVGAFIFASSAVMSQLVHSAKLPSSACGELVKEKFCPKTLKTKHNKKNLVANR